ncbi:MAG: hypothetical protein FWE71_08620 [Nocardioidaceae bacterium]|nr:hypothetical protein [Nocardioidaceae bacterium]MCL2612936.1 hypothetical protein [Nocardioidaceae bacterium]
MYGDSPQIKRRTDQLREQGVELHALADRLVAQTEAVGWRGRAAAALHGRIGERAATLRDLGELHQSASDALASHRHAVDEAKERIAEVQQRAERLVEGARERAAAIERDNADRAPELRVAPAEDDAVLLAFEPPPDGHKDWLTVDLPGL